MPDVSSPYRFAKVAPDDPLIKFSFSRQEVNKTIHFRLGIFKQKIETENNISTTT